MQVAVFLEIRLSLLDKGKLSQPLVTIKQNVSWSQWCISFWVKSNWLDVHTNQILKRNNGNKNSTFSSRFLSFISYNSNCMSNSWLWDAISFDWKKANSCLLLVIIVHLWYCGQSCLGLIRQVFSGGCFCSGTVPFWLSSVGSQKNGTHSRDRMALRYGCSCLQKNW